MTHVSGGSPSPAERRSTAATRWKDSPRLVLAALLMIHVLAHIDRNMLLGFSPQITADLGLTNFEYGFLAGAVWVLSFGLMAMVMGALADRYSRTRVIAAGMVIWSVCTAASGAVHSFGGMVAARLLVASGEAALVPAAASLMTELFGAERRGAAVGIFFLGIPLGIGASFLLAGTLGAAHGWRETFRWLGVAGVVIALPLALVPDLRSPSPATGTGIPRAVRRHVRDVLATVCGDPVIWMTIGGFVLVHMAFAGLAFAQLWLVRERGVDAAVMARQIGALQIVFGVLGAVAGGVLGDRFARRFRGSHAAFVALLIGVCGPLMICYRFAPVGSMLFYGGMCAGFFLPLATYGPVFALIQGLTPHRMLATVTGLTMMLINVIAIALGNLAIGVVSDRLRAAGFVRPLTVALLASDAFVIAALLFFVPVARFAIRRRSVRSSGP